nr:unnamed protein product [Callosobruchus analis]
MNQRSFFLVLVVILPKKRTNSFEITDIAKGMNNSKSYGTDGISNHLLKAGVPKAAVQHLFIDGSLKQLGLARQFTLDVLPEVFTKFQH